MSGGRSITFGRLHVATKRVHKESVTFTLSSEDGGDVVKCRHWNTAHGADWSEEWGRVSADRYPEMGRVHDGSFIRDRATSPDTIWLESIRYHSALLQYSQPANKATGADESAWDQLRSMVVECCPDFDPWSNWVMSGHTMGFPFTISPLIWPTLVALAERFKASPAFKIRSGHRAVEGAWPVRSVEDTGLGVISVGPWGFSVRLRELEARGVRAGHYSRSTEAARIISAEMLSDDQREAYELKRWLHGYKSKHDSVKEVMKHAVRRRIIKNRATPSDIEFFKTLFGVSQVARWIKEANTKTQNEHSYSGKN